IVCVILFMANRVAPAFRFCLDNSTVSQAISIRYSFLSFVTHHRNTYILRTATLFSRLMFGGRCGIIFI
ncbi:MAG: hypothetical protein PUI99_00255, partial [Clostridiales bacterium]|nr:hypothetical protein [Clostridiales bacterium]